DPRFGRTAEAGVAHSRVTRRETAGVSPESDERASVVRPVLIHPPPGGSPAGGGLEACHVDLDHLQHRVDDALGLCVVAAAHQLLELDRDDLPAEPEPVAEPAALL